MVNSPVCILVYHLSSTKPLSVYPNSLQKEIIEYSSSYSILPKLFFPYSPTQVLSLKKEELVRFMSCPLCFMIKPIFNTCINIGLKLWSTRCGGTILAFQTKESDVFDIWIWGTTIGLNSESNASNRSCA